MLAFYRMSGESYRELVRIISHAIHRQNTHTRELCEFRGTDINHNKVLCDTNQNDKLNRMQSARYNCQATSIAGRTCRPSLASQMQCYQSRSVRRALNVNTDTPIVLYVNGNIQFCFWNFPTDADAAECMCARVYVDGGGRPLPRKLYRERTFNRVNAYK